MLGVAGLYSWLPGTSGEELALGPTDSSVVIICRHGLQTSKGSNSKRSVHGDVQYAEAAPVRLLRPQALLKQDMAPESSQSNIRCVLFWVHGSRDA